MLTLDHSNSRTHSKPPPSEGTCKADIALPAIPHGLVGFPVSQFRPGNVVRTNQNCYRRKTPHIR